MAEGDAYTGMMCMSLWSNNRSCDGVSEYMSVWVYMCCTVSYITVCAGMVYIVCIAWHSMVYVLYIIVYISMSVMWWCVTEWSKAHLTHWQGNRAMTEPWASVYMILCQCARSESNLLSAVVYCYLLLSRICALSLCLLSVIWGRSFLLCCCECSVLSLWGFLFSGAVMFGIVSGDSVILIRLYYYISYCLIFVIYYFL